MGAMPVLFPLSLGLDEGVCQLNMRAALAIVASGENINHWAFYLTIGIWIVASIATLFWMRWTYNRYAVTRALPIEYGSLNVAVVVSGLVFYRETTEMDDWQLSLVVAGCAV